MGLRCQEGVVEGNGKSDTSHIRSEMSIADGFENLIWISSDTKQASLTQVPMQTSQALEDWRR